MKDFLRRNGIWLLVIALLLSILIGVSSAFMGGNADPLSNLVTTITTPGETVDVLVTDYGIAVNPLRPDLIAGLDTAGIPHVSIESLKEKAYSLVGRPDDLQWEDQVVAVLEARDGTILDVVRKIKPYDPDND